MNAIVIIFITQINKYSQNRPCLPQGTGIKNDWVTAISRDLFAQQTKGVCFKLSPFWEKNLICNSVLELVLNQKMARAFTWN